MLPVLQLIYASASSLRAGFSSLADILTLLEKSSEESLIKAPRTNVPFNKKISIENLKFKYDLEGP